MRRNRYLFIFGTVLFIALAGLAAPAGAQSGTTMGLRIGYCGLELWAGHSQFSG